MTADSVFKEGELRFVPFELERWQSTWENRVRFNLAESGVHPLSVQELLGLAGASAVPLLEVRLGYSQSNGTDLLRQRIAALYPGASPDHVLVTTGSAEANFVACWRLLEPGDKVAMLLPSYLQIWGQAQNLGAQVRGFDLHAGNGWEPFPEEIRAAIAPGTKLVVVTNPHNPTGHVLSDDARRVILERSREVGAWLLADEVYAGAELNGKTTPSFWGSYDKVICVSGLSKAYGLPGLRIGWLVAPPEFTAESWARHDYTTIGPAGASDHLAGVALAPGVREKIIERTRRILNANYPVFEQWLKRFGDTFSWHPPQAGAICLVKYRQGVGALDVVERIRAQHSVLLVPGEHFGVPQHIRFGYGNELSELQAALAETELGLKRIFTD
ncbi:MAG: aminotransferase [Gemmatimonadetes bacterium]|nr:MAG: aminotransferase [Gemmatimonadota bacterium]